MVDTRVDTCYNSMELRQERIIEMSYMNYCKNEGTANELANVMDDWDNLTFDDPSIEELKGRARIIEMIIELNGERNLSAELEEINELIEIQKKREEEDE